MIKTHRITIGSNLLGLAITSDLVAFGNQVTEKEADFMLFYQINSVHEKLGSSACFQLSVYSWVAFDGCWRLAAGARVTWLLASARVELLVGTRKEREQHAGIGDEKARWKSHAKKEGLTGDDEETRRRCWGRRRVTEGSDGDLAREKGSQEVVV
ncbi:imidazole glycerol phosphate synthase subunit HisF [Striga asiatica]|uniref:Imidazole glycerol phosphate synthase subunit HisF n=1 Tax=Striga asiatica TaxID=4170 RepID=A0A5A7RAM1_STRAF|nr:imidazole glycerol phosphate synthase subunit HisF [Striga asiatica]